MEKMLSEILNFLFEEYEKEKINYVILRNYELLPEKNIGHDIDFLISEKDIENNLRVMNRLSENFKLKFLRRNRHQYVESYFFYLIDSEEVLQLDYFYNGDWHGRYYLTSEEILNNKISYKSFYVPRPDHEAIISVFASLVWGGFFKVKYIDKIINLIEKDKKQYLATLSNILGETLARNLTDAILEKNIDKCEKIVPNLRKSIIKYSYKKAMWSTIKLRWNFIIGELKLYVQPQGYLVLILGKNSSKKLEYCVSVIDNARIFFKNEKESEKYISIIENGNFGFSKIKYYAMVLKNIRNYPAQRIVVFDIRGSFPEKMVHFFKHPDIIIDFDSKETIYVNLPTKYSYTSKIFDKGIVIDHLSKNKSIPELNINKK